VSCQSRHAKHHWHSHGQPTLSAPYFSSPIAEEHWHNHTHYLHSTGRVALQHAAPGHSHSAPCRNQYLCWELFFPLPPIPILSLPATPSFHCNGRVSTLAVDRLRPRAACWPPYNTADVKPARSVSSPHAAASPLSLWMGSPSRETRRLCPCVAACVGPLTVYPDPTLILLRRYSATLFAFYSQPISFYLSCMPPLVESSRHLSCTPLPVLYPPGFPRRPPPPSPLSWSLLLHPPPPLPAPPPPPAPSLLSGPPLASGTPAPGCTIACPGSCRSAPRCPLPLAVLRGFAPLVPLPAPPIVLATRVLSPPTPRTGPGVPDCCPSLCYPCTPCCPLYRPHSSRCPAVDVVLCHPITDQCTSCLSGHVQCDFAGVTCLPHSHHIPSHGWSLLLWFVFLPASCVRIRNCAC